MATGLYTLLQRRSDDSESEDYNKYDGWIIYCDSTEVPAVNSTYTADDNTQVTVAVVCAFASTACCCTGYESNLITATVEASVAQATYGSLYRTFAECTALEYVYKLENLFENMGRTTKRTTSSTSTMFYKCTSLKELDFSRTTFTKAFMINNSTSIQFLWYRNSGTYSPVACESVKMPVFDGNKSYIYTFENLFANFRALKSIDLSCFNGCMVYSTYQMFNNCYALKDVIIPQLTLTSNNTTYTVTDPDGGNDFVLNNTLAHAMFYGCSALEKVDLSKIMCASPVRMNDFFKNCTNLKYADLSNFIANSTNLNSLLQSCTNLLFCKLPHINLFDNNGRPMYYLFTDMFRECTNLYMVDLSGFDWYDDQQNQYRIRGGYMFYNCRALKYIYSMNTTALIFDSSYNSYVFQNCTQLPNWSNNSYTHSYVGDGGYFTDANEIKNFNYLSLIPVNQPATQNEFDNKQNEIIQTLRYLYFNKGNETVINYGETAPSKGAVGSIYIRL